MAMESRQELTALAPPGNARRGVLAQMRRFAMHKPLATIGMGIVLLLIFTAIFAEALAPHDPYDFNRYAVLAAPSVQYPLGTDDFGRDVLSRLMYGSRLTLFISLVSVTMATIVGSLVGLASGAWGGTFDTLAQRVVDAFLAFPLLLLAIIVVAVLGASVLNVTVALAVVLWPRDARVVRSAALAAKQHQYVEAARALGASQGRILFRHILPQCMAPLIVIASVHLGEVIIIESSLSFLGLGTPPPEPSWGLMLAGSQRRIEQAPWLAIWPGVAISLVVFGVNLFGDGLRDILDPRLRTR